MSNLTKCELCNRSFKSSIGLINHIRHHHIKQNHIKSLEVYYLRYVNSSPRTCCKTCGKQTEFVNFDTGYKEHCNHACAVNDPEIAERRNTNFKAALSLKYGENVINPSQVPGHRERVKKTKLERYGDENYLDIEKLRESQRQHWLLHYEEHMQKHYATCMEKYGVKHHTQSDICKNKSKQTCLERYGVENVTSLEDVINRTRETFTERYGGYTWASKSLMEKVHKTMLEKYGARTAYESPAIIEKIKKTNLERYGAENPLQNRDILHRVMTTQRRKSYVVKEHVIDGLIVHTQSRAEEEFVKSQHLLGNIVCDGPTARYCFEGHTKSYHIDYCVTYKDGTKRLVEVKQRHGWFLRELKSGKFLAKVKAAQELTKHLGYLPFKVTFIDTYVATRTQEDNYRC